MLRIPTSQRIAKLFGDRRMQLFGFDTDKSWDYENGFYLTSDNRRIPKIIAHYELYKKIVNLPGHVAEFGVFKGASFVRFLNFRDSLENPHSRKIIGFDAFGKFPSQEIEEDEKIARSHDVAAGIGIPKAELERVLAFKNFTNFDLIPGDIGETLPQYIEKHSELRLALIHVDVDVYQPTKVVLDLLYDRVVPGGVIVFDDYAIINGETRAADEFLAAKNLKIQKFPFCHTPSYVVKP